MNALKTKTFSANIQLIGINPYVSVPARILNQLFKEAGKDKGYIPVRLVINDTAFVQNLVKYRGQWRLYLNLPMRKAAAKDVGDTITIQIAFDSEKRPIPVNKAFESALNKNKKAKEIFDNLPPSRKKEIIRYINNLKTKESIDRNIQRAIQFLLGKKRFIGRDKP